MKLFALCAVLIATLSCQRNDKFLQEPYPFGKERFSKTYQFDTSTSESYAVDVDILWVIDNSGSMSSYQRAVINNSSAFISQFTKNTRLRWQMGLISTSYNERPYMGFDSILDYRSPRPIETFNTAVGRLGINGDAYERMYDPVLKVINGYPNWMRPNAYFIIIAVSDELEQSNTTTQRFLDQIKQKMGGNLARFSVYGVYGPESNSWSNQKYDEIVQLTGGKIYNLDAPDYGVLLAELGHDLVQKTTAVNPIVLLDQKPIPSTIQVIYKGNILVPGKDWFFNSQYNFIEIVNPKILDTGNLNVDVSFEIDSKS